MFRWFIEWRRQRMFNRGFAEAAQVHFDEGEISYDKLQECVKASENKEAMKMARQQMTLDPGMLGGINWDWEAIKQWFIDYFIPAMKVILPIVLMLLATNPTEGEDED